MRTNIFFITLLAISCRGHIGYFDSYEDVRLSKKEAKSISSDFAQVLKGHFPPAKTRLYLRKDYGNFGKMLESELRGLAYSVSTRASKGFYRTSYKISSHHSSGVLVSLTMEGFKVTRTYKKTDGGYKPSSSYSIWRISHD